MRLIAPWTGAILGIERLSKRSQKALEPVSNPIGRARVYEAALQKPATRTQRDVAAAFGVTAAEVSRFLGLLRRLTLDIISAVEHETDPRRLRRLSLRRLEALSRVQSPARQRVAFAAHL